MGDLVERLLKNADHMREFDTDYNSSEPLQREAAAELTRLTAERDAANALVYIPGQWRCPKCEFQLTQSNLNAQDGSVTARDDPGDKCPNCNSPLWRVTYREAFKDTMKLAEDAITEKTGLRAERDAAVAREGVCREALEEAPDFGGEATTAFGREYREWQQKQRAALAISSQRAEAMLAVVKAALKWSEGDNDIHDLRIAIANLRLLDSN